MNVRISDIVILIINVWKSNNLLSSFTRRVYIFLRPLDATRYIEYGYMQHFIRANSMQGLNILDISSPHIMSCI